MERANLITGRGPEFALNHYGETGFRPEEGMIGKKIRIVEDILDAVPPEVITIKECWFNDTEDRYVMTFEDYENPNSIGQVVWAYGLEFEEVEAE